MATAKDKLLHLLGEALRDGSFVKLTLGAYRGRDRSLKQTFIRPVELRDGARLSFVWRYATRDVTKNFPHNEALALLSDVIGTDFRAAHLFTTQLTAQLEFREGRAARLIEGKPAHAAPAATAHDQPKQRHLAPEKSRWLCALGVTTSEGKVAKGMEAKFRQINKFVELLEHLLAEAGLTAQSGISNLKSQFTLLDMGCGKGYLTFAACEGLQQRGFKNFSVRGIEVRPELVELCNRVAMEGGLAGLRFEAGTIASAALDRVDTLIALHACDTATDDAIAKGVQAGASLIVVAPCCHKEMRPQLRPPPVLSDALRHGILLERHAEFVTDALRAALLEWAGYETKVFEFISTEHTAKNLMIAAVKRRGPARGEAAAAKVRELAAFYGVRSQHLARQLGFTLTTETTPA
jgi:SAM-dependent methyltransferase